MRQRLLWNLEYVVLLISNLYFVFGFQCSLSPNSILNMVELRKRKEAPPAQPPPPKKANSVKSSTSSNANGSSASSVKIAVGDTVTLDGFGGEVETNDGEKTTLKALVEKSGNGVVLFTYPKASTPGCMPLPVC